MPEASASPSTRNMVQAVHAPSPEMAEDACNLPRGFLRAIALSRVAQGRPLRDVLAEEVDKRTMKHVDAMIAFRRKAAAEDRPSLPGQYSVVMSDWVPGLEFTQVAGSTGVFEVSAVPAHTPPLHADTLQFNVGDRVIEVATLAGRISRNCVWKQQSQFFDKEHKPSAGRGRFPCMLTMSHIDVDIAAAAAAVVSDIDVMTEVGLVTPAARRSDDAPRAEPTAALPHRGHRLAHLGSSGEGAIDVATVTNGRVALVTNDPGSSPVQPAPAASAVGQQAKGRSKKRLSAVASAAPESLPSVGVAAVQPMSSGGSASADGARKAARRCFGHSSAGAANGDGSPSPPSRRSTAVTTTGGSSDQDDDDGSSDGITPARAAKVRRGRGVVDFASGWRADDDDVPRASHDDGPPSSRGGTWERAAT